MKKIGISVYPEIVGIEKTKKYIDLAHENGFRRIFMNLLEVDKNDDSKIVALKTIATYARDREFEVIVDVNPQVYEELSLPKNETKFFADLNVSGIRLDEDFGGEIEAELSNNTYGLKIELNASAGSSTIDKALELGGNPSNLIACHNFYPMQYTGLDKERFIELTSHYKAIGVNTAAFVTLPKGQEGTVGPWNVNDGMPTLEEHRFMSIEDQVLDLLSFGFIDDIIISSQGATEEQFKAVNNAVKIYNEIVNNESIEIKAELFENISDVERDIILNNKGKEHFNRPDRTSYFVRSTFPRIDYKDEVIKPNNAGNSLKIGDIVVLNENLGRYKGEFHIITREFKDDLNARNVVGRVQESEIPKLKFLVHPMKYSIKEMK